MYMFLMRENDSESVDVDNSFQASFLLSQKSFFTSWPNYDEMHFRVNLVTNFFFGGGGDIKLRISY